MPIRRGHERSAAPAPPPSAPGPGPGDASRILAAGRWVRGCSRCSGFADGRNGASYCYCSILCFVPCVPAFRLVSASARIRSRTTSARKCRTFGTVHFIASVQYLRCSINRSSIEQSERRWLGPCHFSRQGRIIRAMAWRAALDLNKQRGGYSPRWVLWGRGRGGLGSFAGRMASRIGPGAAGDGNCSQRLAVGGAVQIASPTCSVAPELSQRRAGSAEICGLAGPRRLITSLPTPRGADLDAAPRSPAAAKGRRGGVPPFGSARRAYARAGHRAGNLEKSAKGLPCRVGCDERRWDQGLNASQPRMGSGVRGRTSSAKGGTALQAGGGGNRAGIGFGAVHRSLCGDGRPKLGGGFA